MNREERDVVLDVLLCTRKFSLWFEKKVCALDVDLAGIRAHRVSENFNFTYFFLIITVIWFVFDVKLVEKCLKCKIFIHNIGLKLATRRH